MTDEIQAAVNRIHDDCTLHVEGNRLRFRGEEAVILGDFKSSVDRLRAIAQWMDEVNERRRKRRIEREHRALHGRSMW